MIGMYNKNDKKMLEKYSSAITLGDMEIFIFPEIMYSLVLSNIMSPLLWEWKEDDWFRKIDNMNPYRKILRIKQFIMDKFVFNLDLDTWGLTTKKKELERFSEFVDTDILSQSNALFGYEGDKYYFDMDIRKHFGLDKYNSETIPYWKTETLEAMNAFQYKTGYRTGAGECVSLATLYAAALFVIGEIPLEDIYLLGTPLHSQNFVLVKEGIITNNRRIVTKNMWFNGTELSAKARRALQNERVTLLVNNTGYVHTMYKDASIDPVAYEKFAKTLRDFLYTDIDFEIFANFLRQHDELQKYFQFECDYFGNARYIKAEDLYHYENNSPIKIGQKNQCELMNNVDEEDFYLNPIEKRVALNRSKNIFNKKISISKSKDIEDLQKLIGISPLDFEEFLEKLTQFCRIHPRLPKLDEKNIIGEKKIELKIGWSREEVIKYLESIRGKNTIADLAFYANRDLEKSEWKPFLVAAIERNPVIIEATKDKNITEIYDILNSMVNESIYIGESRFAQPDEVWNFSRGDGLEKAIAMINVLKNRKIDFELSRVDSTIRVKGGKLYN